MLQAVMVAAAAGTTHACQMTGPGVASDCMPCHAPKCDRAAHAWLCALPQVPSLWHAAPRCTLVLPLARCACVCRRSRGFGFVEFRDSRDAEDAMSALDRSVVNGREISVSAPALT